MKLNHAEEASQESNEPDHHARRRYNLEVDQASERFLKKDERESCKTGNPETKNSFTGPAVEAYRPGKFIRVHFMRFRQIKIPREMFRPDGKVEIYRLAQKEKQASRCKQDYQQYTCACAKRIKGGRSGMGFLYFNILELLGFLFLFRFQPV
jgi:hypothetical protein